MLGSYKHWSVVKAEGRSGHNKHNYASPLLVCEFWYLNMYCVKSAVLSFQFIVCGSMGGCMSLENKTTLTYFVSGNTGLKLIPTRKHKY